MSDPQDRQSAGDSKLPNGYRSSRRGSRTLKQARRAEKADRVVTGLNRSMTSLKNVGFVIAMALGAVLAVVIALLLVATLINGVARWNAARKASIAANEALENLAAQENILVIGEENGKATGFLAMRVDTKSKQIFGIAIPDGAFIEVPGQGFERVGESYPAGAQVSLAAISNYLTVPFKSYVVVPASAYSALLENQTTSALMSSVTLSSLTDEQQSELAASLAGIPAKSTAFVPLPVKPIKLGSQTYFEPQREEVADLLKAWWGVDPNAAEQVTRVIVYNGAGKPGIAGDAAQELIRAGFRVIDTKNADRFDYKDTTVIVQRGPLEKGQAVVQALGTGIVKQKRTDADVSDIIVIIGKDYTAKQ